MTPPGPTAARVTAGLATAARLDLAAHLEVHGPLGHPASGGAFLAEVERSGLRGRGGAAFPSARKLETVSRRRGRPVVLVNGGEGEPMSRKDRFLLSAAPHLVLDGALSAAEALGAGTVYVAVPERAEAANRSLEAALAERADAGAVTVVHVPERYLAGEETALIHYVDGGPLTPTLTPPLPAERGVGRRPTLVQNVETMAHLGMIARHGGEWFRGVGVPEAPGTALVTLSGAIDRPGIHEIATGTPLAGLFDAAGGPREEIRAVLVGGFFGVWVGREDLVGLTLDPAGLRRCGAALGAGVLVALGASSCPAAETSRVLTWLAGESAGQCGPCVNGLAAVAESFERIVAGHADDAERRRLLRWASEINGRGACGLPNGAVRFLRSALHVFAAEIEDHNRYGACEACTRPPLLRTPGVSVMPVPA